VGKKWPKPLCHRHRMIPEPVNRAVKFGEFSCALLFDRAVGQARGSPEVLQWLRLGRVHVVSEWSGVGVSRRRW